MSLCAQYKQFLASPASSALADNASLHYITTLTSINDAAAVRKHLAVQEKILKKKEEKVLAAIEAPNALSLEIETTLEFVTGGGAYLPGLDDNFVADRTVTFPVIHLVHFENNQVSQIRLHWDQGSLLKQIEVIGARARNWPIRDGKDQARLISRSSGLVDSDNATAPPRQPTASHVDAPSTKRPAASTRGSVSNAMNDPHATLSLFESRDLNQESPHLDRPIAPRMQSAKPPPREYSELFVGEETTSPTPANAASSPEKRIPVKTGGGKNFKPNRLFDDDEEPAATPLSVKTNSKKYNHFEFGDEDDTPKGNDASRSSIKTKHQSQWDFEDFNTPLKAKTKVLGQNVRHFGWSDDEEDHSPVRNQVVHRARPDADPHFEFLDDGPADSARKRVSTKGQMHNKGLGLYKDHILGTSDDEGDTVQEKPTGHFVKNENRKKDFGAQWEMKDENSPGQPQKTFGGSKGNAKVLKSLDSNWGLYDEESEQPKENTRTQGIRTAGNGMGGRKGAARAWAIGDSDDEEENRDSRPITQSLRTSHEDDQSKKENVRAQGIRTAGNGMGGRKGSTRGWAIGDSDGEEDHAAPTSKPISTNNARTSESKGFWDF